MMPPPRRQHPHSLVKVALMGALALTALLVVTRWGALKPPPLPDGTLPGDGGAANASGGSERPPVLEAIAEEQRAGRGRGGGDADADADAGEVVRIAGGAAAAGGAAGGGRVAAAAAADGAAVALRPWAGAGADDERELGPEDFALDQRRVSALLGAWPAGRPRAALFVLARNSDLAGVLSSMLQLEARFNRRGAYPYVFVNDRPFTRVFKRTTSAATSAPCFYGQVPPGQWGFAPHVNQASEGRGPASPPPLVATKAIEGWRGMPSWLPYRSSASYRHMCRYFSGYFHRHPLLAGFDYYWRVEPDVKFFCNLTADPFRITETMPSFPASVNRFLAKQPELIHPTSLWSLGERSGVIRDNGQYNGCHFWSNFEIGRLSFLRSPEYQAFFEHLDREGGFHTERWGDAPVHSAAAAFLLDRRAIHRFEDIGYKHSDMQICPRSELRLRCDCDPFHDQGEVKKDHVCWQPVTKALATPVGGGGGGAPAGGGVGPGGRQSSQQRQVQQQGAVEQRRRPPRGKRWWQHRDDAAE
eukprot:scaffold30.g4450.t1